MIYKISNTSFKSKIKTNKINKLKGFEIKPKNTLSKKKILKVKKINVINDKLISNLLMKKIYLKMEQIITKINDEEDSNPSDLKKSLDETERLRGIVINKYKEYLKKKDFETLLFKLNLIFQEIGIRTIAKQDEFLRNNDKKIESNKSR
jgi:hypothetical protein